MSDDVRAAFDACDLDGRGSISVKELAAVLKAIGEDESLAQAMMKAMDKNADGEVTFDEFKAALAESKSS